MAVREPNCRGAVRDPIATLPLAEGLQTYEVAPDTSAVA